MGHSGITPDIYAERLNLVFPHREALEDLGQEYFAERSPDLLEVLEILQHLQKPIYIVSAGLAPAVISFGKMLKVDTSAIFAVDIYFDAEGHYRDFDENSPLIYPDGKRRIVETLLRKHPRLLFVGDGLNDLVVQDLVTRFVGYGGAYYRENIQNRCEFYLTDPSLLPLLPLTLTLEEVNELPSQYLARYQKGVALLP